MTLVLARSFQRRQIQGENSLSVLGLKWYNRIMEKRIRAYEKFIAREAKRLDEHKMSEAERIELVDIHRETVTNFQHERLIHLLVTLFFALFAILALFVTAWTIMIYGLGLEMLSLYLLTIILVVLSGCYVRHYYFLENHVQGLYKYTRILRGYK